MARKSVVRRIYKYLPRKGDTKKFEQIDRAIEIMDQDSPMSMMQAGFIEWLLMSSTIDFEQQQAIYKEYNGYSDHEAKKCITFLMQNQGQDLKHQTGDQGVDGAVSDAIDKDDFYEEVEGN